VSEVTTVAIELNDAGVVAATDDLRWLDPSPGIAMLDGNELLVGAQAVSRSRLKPRWVVSRFWDRLDVEPLGRPFPRQLRHADLVHVHLAEVWRHLQGGEDSRIDSQSAVVLTVPGFYRRRQLGLLLGIGRACGIPIASMVDSAVAACTEMAEAARLLHVEVLLHRVVVSELQRREKLVRQRVESDQDTGLLAIQDLWAELIASRFVQQTRFDPFHQGATEQDLYDKLPQWVDEIDREGGAMVVLEHRGKIYHAEVSKEELQGSVRAAYGVIVARVRAVSSTGSRPLLVLSDRVSRLPGLRRELEEGVGAEAVMLAPAAAVEGALRHQHRFVEPGEQRVDFVSELPLPQTAGQSLDWSETEVGEVPSEVRMQSPTHLLHEGVAYPILDDPLYLGVALPSGLRGIGLTGNTAGISRRHCSLSRRGEVVVVEDHSTYGTFLNGDRVDGKATLAAGDRLRLGSPGIVLQLIAVE
jgi:hypothetical protein